MAFPRAARLLGCLVLFAAGCGGGLATVTGKVTHKGAPVKGANLIFHPKGGGPEAVRPTGHTGDDGTFTLESIRTPGAAPGEYGVTIVWPQPPGKGLKNMAGGEEERASGGDRLGGRYADRERPKFTVTIKSGSNALEPFAVE
jgi:hypothetical protein